MPFATADWIKSKSVSLVLTLLHAKWQWKQVILETHVLNLVSNPFKQLYYCFPLHSEIHEMSWVQFWQKWFHSPWALQNTTASNCLKSETPLWKHWKSSKRRLVSECFTGLWQPRGFTSVVEIGLISTEELSWVTPLFTHKRTFSFHFLLRSLVAPVTAAVTGLVHIIPVLIYSWFAEVTQKYTYAQAQKLMCT